MSGSRRPDPRFLNGATRSPRDRVASERHTPDLLSQFLVRLEGTENTRDVWSLLVELGVAIGTPFIDFISASSFQNWRRTQFIRTSYDSTWLNGVNQDQNIAKWSVFRSHAMDHLTPVATGIEYLDQNRPIPASRVKVLEFAASLGMRAGFAVPLRLYTPPQAGLITFIGDHDRATFDSLLQEHGWTMNVAALVAYQSYMTHFVSEFSDRNEISEKQRILLEKVGSGFQDKQIAFDLGVSVSAVRQRMALLMEKTGLSNRAELAALATSLGIVPDPLNRPGAEAGIQVDMGPFPEGTARTCGAKWSGDFQK